ncbi:hypothetical protein [Streptomyces sp. WAC01280]|uniref:hypothetical protein n=1 Tax=Streptomyces sp. WAC01280 TaxID=2487424 RepID=UPI00267EB9D2
MSKLGVTSRQGERPRPRRRLRPDKGESVSTLIADPPPGAPVPPILPPNQGFLFLDRDKFADSFAGDLPRAQADFMADSPDRGAEGQVPPPLGSSEGSRSLALRSIRTGR